MPDDFVSFVIGYLQFFKEYVGISFWLFLLIGLLCAVFYSLCTLDLRS